MQQHWFEMSKMSEEATARIIQSRLSTGQTGLYTKLNLGKPVRYWVMYQVR
ncbi:MAG TPA: hypothetical protein V6C95_20055 [Coleofasciculaceae cyanobacterium]